MYPLKPFKRIYHPRWEILASIYCFKGGEQITFILTHHSWLTHGNTFGNKSGARRKRIYIGIFSQCKWNWFIQTGRCSYIYTRYKGGDCKVETQKETQNHAKPSSQNQKKYTGQ